MKVKQLIHELQAMPQDAPVVLQVMHMSGVAETDDLRCDLSFGMERVTISGFTEAYGDYLKEAKPQAKIKRTHHG
jgi:hypothetical protein